MPLFIYAFIVCGHLEEFVVRGDSRRAPLNVLTWVFRAHANALLWSVPLGGVLLAHRTAVHGALVATAKWFSKTVVPVSTRSSEQMLLCTFCVWWYL